MDPCRARAHGCVVVSSGGVAGTQPRPGPGVDPCRARAHGGVVVSSGVVAGTQPRPGPGVDPCRARAHGGVVVSSGGVAGTQPRPGPGVKAWWARRAAAAPGAHGGVVVSSGGRLAQAQPWPRPVLNGVPPPFKPSTVVRKVCCSTPTVVPPTFPNDCFFGNVVPHVCCQWWFVLVLQWCPTHPRTPVQFRNMCCSTPTVGPQPPQ